MTNCEHNWTIYDNTTADGPGAYRICFTCRRAELWNGKQYVLAKVAIGK